jgi:tryptophan synthase beta chain
MDFRPTMATEGANLASFYSDMERLLLKQLAERPDDASLRLKLVEVYYESARRPEFQAAAQRLARTLGQARGADWNRVVSMGRMLGFDAGLFESHDGDRIEFVEQSRTSPAEAAHHRIGEDEQYRAHFQKLAADCAGVFADPAFLNQFDLEMVRIASRPSSLDDAKRLARELGGAQVFIKREDLSPHGSRLTLAVLGQAMLAQKLGRRTLVTASVTGFRGVVTASVAARMGLRSVVCMDRTDLLRQPLQAFQMRLHGAEIVAVDKARLPRGDVRGAALDWWVEHAQTAFPVMGLDGAPPPFPLLTREFVSVIGRECRRQARNAARRAPDLVIARGDNTHDAVGLFEPFLSDETRLLCVDAPPDLEEKLLGNNMYDATRSSQSSADDLLRSHRGLEEPSAAREHGFLKASGRVDYVAGDIDTARKAIRDLARLLGMVPALSMAPVIGRACQEAARMKPEQAIVVMLAENADRDLLKINRVFGDLA